MATAVRTKQNACDFQLFKTPVGTKVRQSILSERILYDSSPRFSRDQYLQYTSRTTLKDLSLTLDTMGTPTRLNRSRFITPTSLQRRRALGLVNQNSYKICQYLSSDELSLTVNSKEPSSKHDDSVVLEAPAGKSIHSHLDEDLPHQCSHNDQLDDNFQDLISVDERVERMISVQAFGVNLFAFPGANENSVRCQSPVLSSIDVSSLIDILE